MKFILRNQKILNNAVEHLYSLELDEDKPFELIIKDHKKLRTEEQNALYWSWLRIISKETGNSTKDLHADFGDLFLPKVQLKTRRGIIEQPKSTTELGVKEFTLYLQQIEAEAADFFGIMLPHPGDLEW